MITMGGFALPSKTIKEMICGSIDVIVQASRLRDGTRKITHVTEVVGMEGDVIQMQEIYKFVRTGMEPDGKILGHFEATGIRPRFLEHLKAMGIEFPGSYFEPVKPKD